MTEITGSTSDGFHTFDELYHHRTLLFAFLLREWSRADGVTRGWKSLQHADGTMFDGFFIVGVTTDLGDATYHCKREYWDLFSHVPELEYAPPFDGHTPDQTLIRMGMAILGLEEEPIHG